ncbi:hypothetical protein F506_04705 [Herbaspirillum hiltneri N3]|uniref:Uncharacterized protein n=1 Tax=Herbaspirillum hiltneri N3 TaxID=1262470 RepID=A0ABN4HTY3_9BURK|nr:hypothetical protein [Herbaspirillum hiltneri]AKZ62064.1 hypothetical protein F506_04705 [Herbaspirillum hiltneri N3]
MSPVASPAIVLLQQLETLLRDPVMGPRVAQRVAAAMEAVVQEKNAGEAVRPDLEAYARLWIPAWDEAGREQAWISLASI